MSGWPKGLITCDLDNEGSEGFIRCRLGGAPSYDDFLHKAEREIVYFDPRVCVKEDFVFCNILRTYWREASVSKPVDHDSGRNDSEESYYQSAWGDDRHNVTKDD